MVFDKKILEQEEKIKKYKMNLMMKYIKFRLPFDRVHKSNPESVKFSELKVRLTLKMFI